MRYLKCAQFVPNKGEAWMIYELDDAQTIQRFLTFIPNTGELTKVPNSPIKKLFRPETLEEATEQEFLQLWSQPEKKGA